MIHFCTVGADGLQLLALRPRQSAMTKRLLKIEADLNRCYGTSGITARRSAVGHIDYRIVFWYVSRGALLSLRKKPQVNVGDICLSIEYIAIA